METNVTITECNQTEDKCYFFNDLDILMVIRKRDKKSFFGRISKKKIKSEDDSEIEDYEVTVSVYDTCNFWFIECLDIKEASEKYVLCDEYININQQFADIFDNLTKRNSDIQNIVSEQTEPTDTEIAYNRSVDNSRYISFINKISPKEKDKKIHVKADYTTDVYMKVDHMTLSQQPSGLSVLRCHGTSIQLIKKTTGFGCNYIVLHGNADSFVDVIPIDMAIALKKYTPRTKRWEPYDIVDDATIKESVEKFTEQIKEYSI